MNKRNLLDKTMLSIASLLCFCIIICGYTYLLLKITSWMMSRVPVFHEEQKMAAIFIWIYSFLILVRVWKNDKTQ